MRLIYIAVNYIFVNYVNQQAQNKKIFILLVLSLLKTLLSYQMIVRQKSVEYCFG